MAKEKSVNPAQAQRKAEKQKQLKKSKAEQATRRNERLSKRNPERLQRELDDLRKAQESGQVLNGRDKKALQDLENEVKAVRKAREALGDQAPQFNSRPSDRGGAGQRGRGRGRGSGGRDGGGSSLGKRRRGSNDAEEEGGSRGSTPESVRGIPMPRDTPPPVPPEFQHLIRGRQGGAKNTNANLEPLGPGGSRLPHALPEKPSPAAETSPAPPAKTTYEAKPVIRNLQREAVSKFVPDAVRKKIEATKGTGGRLLEPEEVEALEKEGYAPHGEGARRQESQAGDETTDGLEEEERRFERELRAVQIEEVEDEGD
ncbi:MAG: hypothetical protein M4579_004318 [Chaenotheca gracillima]|nr:MAG: hypothetical protein M4579_004318 [Chaenotheca gracillima]